MRLYVTSYSLSANNHYVPVRELGIREPVSAVSYGTDMNVHCTFIPIPDAGESTMDILNKLSEWIQGMEINMVKAERDRPRCFYCGTKCNANDEKCKYCGGEIR